MKIKRSIGSLIFDSVNVVIMVLLVFITLYPVINVFAVSISSNYYVVSGQVNLIPRGINFTMYRLLLSTSDVQRAYLNSVLYTATHVVVMLILNSIYAFALSKPNLPGKKPLTVFIAVTMFFSGGLIPSYLINRALGAVNSFWVMVLPGACTAWTIIMMRTFFQSIPHSLTESALIDGAGEVSILMRIIIPLSKPLYATMSLLSLVGSWNAWFNGSIYLIDRNRYPIQLMLREISILGKILDRSQLNDPWLQEAASQMVPQQYRYAMMMIVMIPIIICYPFFQKFFVKGIMIGAIKG